MNKRHRTTSDSLNTNCYTRCSGLPPPVHAPCPLVPCGSLRVIPYGHLTGWSRLICVLESDLQENHDVNDWQDVVKSFACSADHFALHNYLPRQFCYSTGKRLQLIHPARRCTFFNRRSINSYGQTHRQDIDLREDHSGPPISSGKLRAINE